MLNKAILIGRLTKNPDVRVTNSGIPVASFTLAVNRNYSSANGEKEADFINCVCYRKLAEIVGKYLNKGSLISVEGRIQTRSYEGQDGQRRYVTEVICDNVVFLETRQQQSNNYQQNNNYQQSNNYQQNSNYQQKNYQQQPTFNINQNQQNQSNNPSNNKQDDFFNDNIDISEDDLPF